MPLDGERARVCPECGWAAGVVPPQRRRWGRVLQFMAAGATLLAMGWAFVGNWPAYGPVTAIPFGTTSLEFPAERLSFEDVSEYAEGRRSDGRLLLALTFDDAGAEHRVRAGFGAAMGSATEFARYGWPAPIVVYRWDATYTDVYTRDRAVQAPRAGPERWNALTHVSQRSLADGRRETRLLQLEGFVPLAVIITVVCFVTFGVATRLGVRRRRTAVWASAVVSLAALVALASVPATDADITSALGASAPPIGLHVGDIARLQGEPGGEAEAARAVLGAQPPEASGVLVRGLDAPVTLYQWVRYGGWPDGVVIDSAVTRTGTPEAPRSFGGLSMEEGWISLLFVPEDGYGGRRINISVAKALRGAAVLLLVGIGVGGGVRLARRWKQRRCERRVREGKCARCAYELGV